MRKKSTLNKSKRIIFYSSVKYYRQFSLQGFYRKDIILLREMGYDVKLSKSFLNFFRFWTYDIAFIYFYRAGLLPAMIARLFFKKVIFTGGADNLDESFAGKKNYLVQKFLFTACSMFSNINIVVSKSDMRNIKKFYTGSNLALIRHSIKVNEYLYDRSPKENIITTTVWMGRTENVIRKGVDTAIMVFDKFYNEHPDYFLYIIGLTGDGTEYLRKIIENLPCKGNIIFTGGLNDADKIAILKKSRFYLQLSLYEGFGLAALEALAAGNIVIHSGMGGLNESVGEFGIVVDNTNSVNSIARILSDSLTWDQNVLNKKLKEGRNHALELFDDSRRLSLFREFFASFEK
ncbi:MAG: glycosyltransferase [Deltaproteobacteria bacterium]|nr:glycosyltransferase [Deltaproteobacteria bacterium]